MSHLKSQVIVLPENRRLFNDVQGMFENNVETFHSYIYKYKEHVTINMFFTILDKI